MGTQEIRSSLKFATAWRLHSLLRRVLIGAVLAGWGLAFAQAPAASGPLAPASAAGIECPPLARLPSAEERDRALAQAQDRGFLWRISKAGKTSWLYGTIHLARREWMFPGPTVSGALRASDVLAVELDIADAALMSRLQSGMGAVGRDAAAPTLPEDLAVRLRRQLRVACAPPEMMLAMSPEMVGATLVLMSARRDGLDASYGIDPALAQVARGLKKTVVSLETPELQLNLMRSTSAADLREGMVKLLADLEQDRARPLLLRVARVWAEGRDDELARYREWCECAESERERALLKAMLDDRNLAMAARIDALHAQGREVFAAVGSLHMFGPQALPALMAERGYRVERVVFKP